MRVPRGPVSIDGDLGANAAINIGSKIQSGMTNNYSGSRTAGGQMLGTVTISRQLLGPITVESDGGGAAGAPTSVQIRH